MKRERGEYAINLKLEKGFKRFKIYKKWNNIELIIFKKLHNFIYNNIYIILPKKYKL